MICESDSVILTEDIPTLGLFKGDVGTVVMVHNDGEGYEVEFISPDGGTVAVASFLPFQIRPLFSEEIYGSSENARSSTRNLSAEWLRNGEGYMICESDSVMTTEDILTLGLLFRGDVGTVVMVQVPQSAI